MPSNELYKPQKSYGDVTCLNRLRFFIASLVHVVLKHLASISADVCMLILYKRAKDSIFALKLLQIIASL